jgi:hypothetical protein
MKEGECEHPSRVLVTRQKVLRTADGAEIRSSTEQFPSTNPSIVTENNGATYKKKQESKQQQQQ